MPRAPRTPLDPATRRALRSIQRSRGIQDGITLALAAVTASFCLVTLTASMEYNSLNMMFGYEELLGPITFLTGSIWAFVICGWVISQTSVLWAKPRSRFRSVKADLISAVYHLVTGLVIFGTLFAVVGSFGNCLAYNKKHHGDPRFQAPCAIPILGFVFGWLTIVHLVFCIARLWYTGAETGAYRASPLKLAEVMVEDEPVQLKDVKEDEV